MSIAVTLFVGVWGASSVMAVTSTSDNYQVTETQFSSGSTLKSCSGQYCSEGTIGDTSAATKSNSDLFEAITSNEPLLEMIVESGESNLGVLSTERASTKTTTIRIRSYLSGGYGLQIIGDAPKFGDHTLKKIDMPTDSMPGTEQFGINLAANTSPTVGAAALQVPADQDVFGRANPNYETPNKFMYSSGAEVARSLKDTGRTDYTVSMIINISSSTPAGLYSGDFAAVMIPAF